MWNYRIVRHRTKGVVWYGLHEVYYRENGKLWLWSDKPECVGDTVKDLVAGLAMQLRDATKSDVPILKKSQMPGEKRRAK